HLAAFDRDEVVRALRVEPEAQPAAELPRRPQEPRAEAARDALRRVERDVASGDPRRDRVGDRGDLAVELFIDAAVEQGAAAAGAEMGARRRDAALARRHSPNFS